MSSPLHYLEMRGRMLLRETNEAERAVLFAQAQTMKLMREWHNAQNNSPAYRDFFYALLRVCIGKSDADCKEYTESYYQFYRDNPECAF